MSLVQYDEPQPERRQTHSIGELIEVAGRIHNTAMVPQALRNKPDEVLAVMLAGNELGLPMMQSLQLIDNIQGKPTLNAQGQRALILGAGHQMWVEEASPTHAVVCGIRKGTDRLLRAEFTIAEAQAMGLTNKGPWKSSPEDMCVARACTRFARRFMSDVCMGVAYDADELDQGTPAVTSPASPAQRPQQALDGPPPTFTPENQQRFLALCEREGVDPERVIEKATGGRTCDIAEAFVSEQKAIKDALDAIKNLPTGEVVDAEVVAEAAAPAPAPQVHRDPEPIGAKKGQAIHKFLGARKIDKLTAQALIWTVSKYRTGHASELLPLEEHALVEGVKDPDGIHDFAGVEGPELCRKVASEITDRYPDSEECAAFYEAVVAADARANETRPF